MKGNNRKGEGYGEGREGGETIPTNKTVWPYVAGDIFRAKTAGISEAGAHQMGSCQGLKKCRRDTINYEKY